MTGWVYLWHQHFFALKRDASPKAATILKSKCPESSPWLSLTHRVITWLKQTFTEADKNGDGSLSISEVLQLLHKLNVNLPRQKVKQMFKVQKQQERHQGPSDMRANRMAKQWFAALKHFLIIPCLYPVVHGKEKSTFQCVLNQLRVWDDVPQRPKCVFFTAVQSLNWFCAKLPQYWVEGHFHTGVKLTDVKGLFYQDLKWVSSLQSLIGRQPQCKTNVTNGSFS